MTKLGEYQVTIPIVGVAYATVEATSEEEAIDKAMDLDLEIEQWNSYRHVVRGNVWCAEEPSEASAERVDDAEVP